MADPELFAMVAEGTMSELSPEVGREEYLANSFFFFEGSRNNSTVPE